METNNSKLLCLIVDDEQPAQWVLSSYIKQVEQFELVGCAFDASEAQLFFNKTEIDVLFLDINLPGLTGFDLLNTLKHQPMVVFTTAFSDYALHSFEYNVVDYLVKPISRQQFSRAADRVLEKATLSKIKQHKVTIEIPDKIEIRFANKSEWVKPEEIAYLQSCGNYVRVFLENKMLMVISTTRKLMEVLPANLFLQIHKSFVVNKIFIQSYNSSEVVVLNKSLPIGISYKQVVTSAIEPDVSDL
jgi:DNA-binding LytR/AlgR family response regulator